MIKSIATQTPVPFDFSPAHDRHAFQTNPSASVEQLRHEVEMLLNTARELAEGVYTDGGPSADALAHASEFMTSAALAAFLALNSKLSVQS